MSETVIKVENLSKKYIIGHQRQERYTALRDVMTEGAKNFARKILHPFNSSTGQRFNDSTEEFYALKDVSFEIKRGDRVGIIGRNGAGKSTLLKILSRITEPTSGRIEIDGRVASLLEVGTGFHPELTGRENIFLNGAILGMTREEIRRKFDEIVAFAEIEKFLDTPVKRYSSGMYVRLAFAVAAHLEPEILIVDEVLAVGDAQFQKKCLGKMEEVGKEGRTVLFVSHQLDMIKALCTKGVFLKNGQNELSSTADDVVSAYLHENIIEANGKQVFNVDVDDDMPMQVVAGRIYNGEGKVKECYDVFEDIIIELHYYVNRQVYGGIVNIEVKRNEHNLFCTFDTDCNCELITNRDIGLHKTIIKLPTPYMKPGRYYVSPGTGVANSHKIQQIYNAIIFDLEIISRESSLLSCSSGRVGVMSAIIKWDDSVVKDKGCLS